MGGIAAIAKAAGHTVIWLRRQRCTRHVRSSHAGHRPRKAAGTPAARRRRDADVFVIGNVVSRGNLLMEAILDRGCRTSRAAVAARERPRTTAWVLAGTHGRPRPRRCSRGSSRTRDSRRDSRSARPMDFPVSARLDAERVLRHRGGRVRHGVLRQAVEVRTTARVTAISTTSSTTTRTSFPDLAAIETQFHHLVRMDPADAGASSSTAATRIAARWVAAAGARSGRPDSPRCPKRPGWTVAMDGTILLAARGSLAGICPAG